MHPKCSQKARSLRVGLLTGASETGKAARCSTSCGKGFIVSAQQHTGLTLCVSSHYIPLFTSRGGNCGPKARPIRRLMMQLQWSAGQIHCRAKCFVFIRGLLAC